MMSVHDLVEVPDRQQLPARHVAQFRMRGEEYRRREFRRKVIREIEVDVEAAQVALLLTGNLVDLLVRETPARLSPASRAAAA